MSFSIVFNVLYAGKNVREIVYNIVMAKRNTGVGKGKKRSPHKTAKRLAAKRTMLAAKKSKRRK